MAIGSGQENRISRHNFVEVLSRRELRRFPKGLNPAPADNPFAGCGFADALFHLGKKRFQSPGAFEIEAQFAFSNPENRLSFAYVMNQMEQSLLPNEKSLRLVDAIYL